MSAYIGYLIAIVILVVMSAYFSATETAFSTLNRMKVRAIADKGGKKGKRAELVLKLSENYDKLISTILIGNNIVNISLASVGAVLFLQIDPENGASISTAVITLIVLVFGEISPKSIAKDSSEKFSFFSAPIINILIYILTPVNFIFTMWKKFLSFIFKIEDETKISSEELIMMVDEVQKDGNLDLEDSELIKNAIEFSENVVEKIITHRVDLEGVDITASKEEVADLFSKTQFSRILVYEDSIDKIIGVIHMKDFYMGTGVTGQNIKDIMTKPIFIQKSEKVNDLLKLLQKTKSHIAVVLDEYGGTMGIVTMEDILEELVGEIWDEHDDIIEYIKEVDKNTYTIDCGVDFVDFCKFFCITDVFESNSVGGWVSEQLGKIPELYEKFIYDNLEIEVTELDLHRVLIIKVREIEEKEDCIC